MQKSHGLRIGHSLTFLLLLLMLITNSNAFASSMPSAGTIEVFFSPRGGVTEAVVREIGDAKKEILVQAYSFTSAWIAKALIDAKKRGVSIAVVEKRKVYIGYVYGKCRDTDLH